ncbi:hypothetical protein [Polaromonas sp. CG9_12]|nr:hypothetical protein [Polaromonas sp. CG9_12]
MQPRWRKRIGVRAFQALRLSGEWAKTAGKPAQRVGARPLPSRSLALKLRPR